MTKPLHPAIAAVVRALSSNGVLDIHSTEFPNPEIVGQVGLQLTSLDLNLQYLCLGADEGDCVQDLSEQEFESLMFPFYDEDMEVVEDSSIPIQFETVNGYGHIRFIFSESGHTALEFSACGSEGASAATFHVVPKL